MKVLVTGGLGVVGSRIVQRLIEARHFVVVLDAMEAPRNRWIAGALREIHPPSMTTLAYRLEDLGAKGIAQYLEHFGVDAVIHAAASTGIPHSVLHPDDDWRSNVDATRALLEAIRKHPVPTVVLSSVKPYRVPVHTHAWTGLTESDVLEPDEPYAASKAAQSMLAMAYARSYDLPVVTFRCSNLYGPAPCHGPRHGWLTWFAISAAIGRTLEVQGTGEQTRDMLHADDVFEACILALAHATRLRGRVFNLGGGAKNRVSVLEAATSLSRLGGVGIERAPARSMDDLHVFANTSAFLRETTWRPLVSVGAGMQSVFEWAQANADSLRALYAEV